MNVPNEPVAQPRWDKFLFREALEKMPEWGCIFEVGAIRDIRNIAARADGHSTVKWRDSGKKTICVDIDPSAIYTAQKLVGTSRNVEFVCDDAFQYLKGAKNLLIGLLYLDGTHPKTEDGVNFCLECFKAAEPYLRPGSVILIDACDVSPGKGDLVIPYALANGYVMVMKGYRQVMLKMDSPKVQVLAQPRVGLVGYDCHTGLGELNRQIDQYCDLELWLQKTHSHWASAITPRVRMLRDHFRVSQMQAINQSDVLLFCEGPYFKDLLRLAKKAARRTVCVPMYEWLPKGQWTKDVDLFICPTKQCFDILVAEGLPCTYFPWPVDTNRFQFVQRTECKRFLFINGRGGWNGRKGWKVLEQALQIWPEMPLTVISQVPLKVPDSVTVLKSVEDNNDLYLQGDVLIAPHTVDGLGLEPHEAMACGMPVLTPDAAPWNENPAIGRIPTTQVRQKVARDVTWHLCHAKDLVKMCKDLMTQDLSDRSKQYRAWAESRSWDSKKEEFVSLVRG